MGCQYSTNVESPAKFHCVQNDNYSCAISRLQQLSERQICVIRKTWKILDDDLTGRGIKLFFRILDADTQVQSLFPWRYVPRASLTGNLWFKGHASRFMQALGAVVECLGSSEEYVFSIICDIGRKHAKNDKFSDRYFNLFETKIAELLEEELGKHYNEEARQAWTVVIQCLTLGFRIGYNMEKEDQESLKIEEQLSIHDKV